MEAPANWYPDPGNPAQLRYWDGTTWTPHEAVVPAATQVAADARAYYPAPVLALVSSLSVVACTATMIATATLSLVGAADDGVPYEGAYYVALVLTGVFQVIAFVTSCLWLWQMRANAEVLRPNARHARARGWIWGCWFCPIVNLWFPLQVVQDIRSATDPKGRRKGLTAYWWTGLLFMWFASRLTFDPAYGTEALATWEVVAALGAVLAAVMWVLIVRHVTRDQAAAAAQLA